MLNGKNDPFLTFEEQASFVLELLTNPEGMAQVRTLKQNINCALVKNMQLNERKIPFEVWTGTKTQRKPCRRGNRDLAHQ